MLRRMRREVLPNINISTLARRHPAVLRYCIKKRWIYDNSTAGTYSGPESRAEHP